MRTVMPSRVWRGVRPKPSSPPCPWQYGASDQPHEPCRTHPKLEGENCQEPGSFPSTGSSRSSACSRARSLRKPATTARDPGTAPREEVPAGLVPQRFRCARLRPLLALFPRLRRTEPTTLASSTSAAVETKPPSASCTRARKDAISWEVRSPISSSSSSSSSGVDSGMSSPDRDGQKGWIPAGQNLRQSTRRSYTSRLKSRVGVAIVRLRTRLWQGAVVKPQPSRRP